MKLNDILSTYHTDPKKSRKYAKEICSNLHGTVQKSVDSKLTLLLISAIIIFEMITLCINRSGIFSMLLMIVVSMGLVVWNMYFFSWELTFDGATGFFSFHTMFKGTIRFHASEIGRIHTVTLHNRGQRTECLCLPVDNIEIRVVLRKYYLRPSNTENSYQGCDTNAEKLEQYLTLYQQFLAKEADFNTALDDGLSPAVRRAIAQQKRQEESYIPKQANIPQEMPSVPESSPVSETPVKLEKSAPKTVTLSKKTESVIPEPQKAQNSPFPDPTISAFPDPAMKKEVDTDALFNGVLNQFGKAPVSSSPKSKKDVDADALFDNVLKQFGKK